jgi:LCP family protein required for cell wall assembly
MARGDKPYRVYRGGRTKGRVPLQRRAEQAAPPRDGRPTRRVAPPTTAPARRRRRGWGRRIGLIVLVVVLIVFGWAIAGYFALAKAMDGAHGRLGPVALDDQRGLMLANPSTILLLGTDHGPGTGRQGARRSDSIMLVRTDPARGRTAYLSIPRDLRVDVPGRGFQKINAAYQFGGPDLAIRTIRDFTGLKINHVVVVDFRSFERLIDALGGVTVDVKEPIVSNRFDCPFSAQRCAHWRGWRFAKGKQKMGGRRALIYSRIRENQLNPAENDLTRGERQQQVVRAIADKITSSSTLVKLPWLADDLVAPLATDLTGSELAQLAWVKVRSGKSLRCRLGGTPSQFGGESYIVSSEENRNVILMFLGVSAPQPPLPRSGLFGPGCIES